jgi:osmotically-inducible protein OsmY
VKDGEVTPSGSVPTYYSRMKAFDTAINTAGVTDVTNYIVVT